MPVLKHAKKKLRQDKKRTVDNLKIKNLYKKLLKQAKAKPSAESISAAFSAVDKAAKKFIIHKNKAARLKSSLAKAVSTGPVAKTTVKTTTKAKSKLKAKATRTSAKAAKQSTKKK